MWRMDTVRALFNPMVADEILKIRVPFEPYKDKWIWIEEANGCFKVKSAYRLFQAINSREVVETSNRVQENYMWKSLWKMHVPQKIKNFAWRACKNILPTLTNLRHRNMIVEEGCSFCLRLQQQQSFKENVKIVLDNGTEADLALFFVLCWGMWYRRNKHKMEGERVTPNAAANMAMSLHKSFTELKNLNATVARKSYRWKHPPPEFLKLNVDGATFIEYRKVGIGLILRDSTGTVVMAATISETEVNDPSTIELLAILRGMQMCIPLGIPKLMVESDCLMLVNELQSSQAPSSVNSNLVMEVKNLMSCFHEVLFEHVNRTCNGVAHVLARYAWNVCDVQMWWGSAPAFAGQALWFDHADL
ncbi:uncharacterized protein LOC122277073 [Carya illinoinensis]|uniref:uncharacterized protein LOC122277073 n=1 Tax=Carya illinoinensis TaxID=32201 RepID=UPI001C71B883|nr:uncharacterized protein LOC122277073 [Carya illinoinensis]